MIAVVFDPARLEDEAKKRWWKDWRREAEDATVDIVKIFEDWFDGDRKSPLEFKFKDTVWKKLRDWLLDNVFHGKCAYCEVKILRQPGDAEHFRPKGAVKRKDPRGKIVSPSCEIADPGGQMLEIPHPGYFWLAYDWRNLLPSCSDCNKGPGKKTRFDTEMPNVFIVEMDDAAVLAIPEHSRPRASRWPRRYYPSVAVLEEQERPLFLNPMNPEADHNPRRHIRFGTKGLVSAWPGSLVGERTIEVFNLKDEGLRQARQAAQENFWRDYCDAMKSFDPNSQQSEAELLLERYKSGAVPFSAAALDYHGLIQKAQVTRMGSQP
jgi:hypothetical protein